jgi:hypothetical protein
MQFFARFYAWYLFRTNRPKSAIEPWEAIKKHFGMARRILRIGKFIENLKAAAVAYDNKNPVDSVLRHLAVGRQLGYAGYLGLETIATVDALGIKKFAAAKRLQNSAYRAWLAGLLCSLSAGFYTLWRLQQKEKTVDRKEGEGVVEAKKIERFVLHCFCPPPNSPINKQLRCFAPVRCRCCFRKMIHCGCSSNSPAYLETVRLPKSSLFPIYAIS